VSEESNIDKVLRSIQSASPAELMSIWRSRDVEKWSRSSETYRTAAERILRWGEPLPACDILSEALAKWPEQIRLRQLHGLALARSGATERANSILETLRRAGQADEETLGVLGRTYKDLAKTAPSPGARAQYLKRAAEIYGEAYRTSGGYWSGINAATMNLLIGENDRACEIAGRVREQCLKEMTGRKEDRYWELGTLGEAALICRDWPQAEEWYARAADEAKGRVGDLESSRRNARLILQYWKEDPSWLDKLLHVPNLIVFAGHMIDRPDRASPRFPGELEPVVAKEIRARIDKLKPALGFASAACGSDILFLEAMLDMGSEFTVVLPYNAERFVLDSVDFVPNSDWRARFENVMARATRVVTASAQKLEIGSVSNEFCNEFTFGLALARARMLDTRLIPLAVWNGLPGDGPGGAASAIENWRRAGYEPEILNCSLRGGAARADSHADNFGADARSGHGQSRKRRRAESGDFASRIVAILFADAVGFSKLGEAEVPTFVEHFLGGIARLSQKFSDTIITKNTWGDGLYFVFSNVNVAGKFALELADFVAGGKWEEKGLHQELDLRIALHAGPVYEFVDPITGNRTCSGTHVSRAARIEPVIPPGQVYASEAFGALAAARCVTDFKCEYVGPKQLDKNYGTLPIYYVCRSKSAASL
jgi:class 3 adenylate cyclase